MAAFTCAQCEREFSVPQSALDKYPGWKPKICLRCKDGAGSAASSRLAASAKPWTSGFSREENLSTSQVLMRYAAGPKTGVFTDGAAHPNPGPGGWGAVYVVDNSIIAEKWGSDPGTTNNRMELTAILAGIDLVPQGVSSTLWTDSQLCVNTFTKWAKGWEARGWRRKEGEIKNLDLVKEAYGRLARRPELELCWVAAHSGFRWNEYADSLATAYRRSEK